ncbi:stearoyl-CoA desaturase (delta-9 desaturase) [Kibdelosporangium banguiense]|uniref:Stearoyl-CoA desaturase (Delta-9 desaturase) n=1 Tax=Kibdelosporangium banguiense TaxID=1365924 RepID=A0ABS4TB03_9PSEU|nr:acyl-CoA desaturase [Kibdelosporangium banguiense]MBP2321595.1 stearoyl-CoA desaturase (delta-9 desaturase) [Kibdelosporangium banguiense]
MRILRLLAYVTVITSTLGFAGAVAFSVHYGLTGTDLALFAVMYLLTSFGVEGGLHRFFTHKSYSAGPVMTVLLGIAGSMAAQGPILFWASVHRRHHAFADRDGDPHSPRPVGHGGFARLKGIWHGHMGWLFTVDPGSWRWHRLVPELLRDRTVVRLNRLYPVWVLLGLAVPTLAGLLFDGGVRGALGGLLWGGLARMFALHHVTWSVNSFGHLVGNRPHRTRDRSHNIASLATITVGGSWHNNHHAQPALAHNRQGFWQFDLTGTIIRLLDRAGLVHDVRYPVRRVPKGVTR